MLTNFTKQTYGAPQQNVGGGGEVSIIDQIKIPLFIA